MAAVNSASGAPAAREKHRTSSTMRSSQALTLPPLLSCHSRYAAFSLATLSEEDPMAVTSRSGHGQMGPEPRERARSYHAPPPWTRAPNLGSRLPARGVSSTRDPGGPAHEITPIPRLRVVLPLAGWLYVAGPQAAARHR